MANQLERYQKLGIGDSLLRIYRYPIACKELSFILRGAYSKLPKNVQSLVFQDTLAAFRLFPQMQTQNAVSAANSLAQAAEAALPKQKKNLAATEFKHAKIAHKRQSKLQQEEKDCAQLPQDILLHIMSFLDLQSLVSAGLVCWSWNLAAGEGSLWQALYIKVFGHPGAGLDSAPRKAKLDEAGVGTFLDWRQTFKKAYIGKSSGRLVSNRGYCRICKAIVWLNHTACSNQHPAPRSGTMHIKPVLPQQVVDYILDELLSSESESDTDTEGHSVSRLWAYSKAIPHQRYS